MFALTCTEADFTNKRNYSFSDSTMKQFGFLNDFEPEKLVQSWCKILSKNRHCAIYCSNWKAFSPHAAILHNKLLRQKKMRGICKTKLIRGSEKAYRPPYCFPPTFFRPLMLIHTLLSTHNSRTQLIPVMSIIQIKHGTSLVNKRCIVFLALSSLSSPLALTHALIHTTHARAALIPVKTIIRTEHGIIETSLASITQAIMALWGHHLPHAQASDLCA